MEKLIFYAVSTEYSFIEFNQKFSKFSAEFVVEAKSH